ncbi:MAG: TIGR04283 family arsenosugar biosynthesis glycosyltransferase [Hyphococcus sp.]
MDDNDSSGAVSVVIPALNAAARLPACLKALAAGGGLVGEIIVVDGGSSDETVAIAERCGARVLTAPPGRGGQLRVGAAAAGGAWLLFVHADTVLEAGWADEVRTFIDSHVYDAGVFTLAFDARSFAPWFVAAGAMARTRLVKSPYGDQGLLISRTAYERTGGFRDLPLFEDVDIVKRFLRSDPQATFHILSSKAVTSAERYEREGYARRVIRNFMLLMRYRLGASPEKLTRDYG